MARDEHDREDVMREAAALVERVELRVAGEPQSVIVGFRRNGCASFFFGSDPVYQFNTGLELRRAFRGGKLLKAERGLLVEMTRERTADATVLVSRELDARETATLLDEIRIRFSRLSEALTSGLFSIAAQVPADADLTPRIVARVKQWCGAVVIATSPHAV